MKTETEPTNKTEAKAAEAAARKAEREAKAATKATEVAARKAEREAAALARRNAPRLPCLCGCGATPTGKSNFRPGHDAKLVGMVARGEADAKLLDGHPALQAKATKMRDNLATAAAKSEASKAAKVFKSAAKAQTDAEKETARVAAREAKAKVKADADAAKAAAKAETPAKAGTQDADVEIRIGKDWVPGSKISEENGRVAVRHLNAKREWTTSTVPAKQVRDIEPL